MAPPVYDCKSLKFKKDNLTSRREHKMSTSLKNTIEKIKTLENEKKNLLVEIEGLKKMVDAKAVALESEVGTLRDEVKSLKTLVGPEPSSQSKMQL